MTHGFSIALAASTADHASHAAIAAPATAETLIAALFLAGLAGGAAHCAGMCGPFVLAQTAGRLAAVPVERFGRLTRLGGALLLPYHLGRATTYAGLGAVGAGLAGGISDLTAIDWIRTALLTLAALLMAGAALEKSGLALPKPAGAVLGRWVGQMARPLLALPAGRLQGYLLGIAL